MEQSVQNFRTQENLQSVMCTQWKLCNVPAHLHHLIRVFVVSMKKLYILGHQKCTFWRFWIFTECMSKGTFPDVATGNTSSALTLSTLGKIFSRQHFEIFFKFFPKSRIWHFMKIVSKAGFDMSWKLSPLETIFMKCQILLSGKIRKIQPICHQLN